MLPKVFYQSGLLILLALVLFQNIHAQRIEGIPIIKNFSKNEYNASTQNWSICQGSEGYMYFGNNQGILQYSGYDWQLLEMSNYSIVRSVKSGGKDSIFAGAFNELGLLNHDNMGRPQFNSWNSKIPVQYRNYGEIWRIHILGDFTIFQSFKSIIIFKKGEFYKILMPQYEFRFSYLIDNKLYIQDRNRGLFKLEGDKLELVQGGDFFKDREIWSLFRLTTKQLLVGTQYGGFYILEDGKIRVWNNQANQFMLKNTLFNGIRLGNGQLAFGSVMNGLIITDLDGNIKVTLNKQTSIQNNTVLSLFEDKLHNVWLGLDNGIDYIKINNPLSFVRQSGGFGTGYCSIIFQNSLYAGTNQGLFKQKLNYEKNLLQGQNNFSLVANTEGQVWGLFSLNGSLLCGHNSGLFVIHDDVATCIFNNSGVWDVKPIPDQPDLFIVGTYYGFYLLQEKNHNFSVVGKINGIEESSRNFFFDKKGFLWMSHGYNGIFQLQLSPDCLTVKTVRMFNSSNGLPKDYNNEAVLIRNNVLATTENGIYEFNYVENKFEYSGKWNLVFNRDTLKFIRMLEGDENKIWVFKNGSIQLLTYLNDKVNELSTRPFLPINNTLSRSFENVLKLEPNRYLLGTEDGFVIYNDNESPPEVEKSPLSIAWAECIRNDSRSQTTERIPIFNTKTNNIGKIPYHKRHLIIKLSMPFFENQELVKFRYRVNNTEWSNWLDGNTLFISDISNGTYKLNIQCTIDEQDIVGETQAMFIILPPIYRSWYAYLFYLFMTAGLLKIGYFYVKRRATYEKRKEYLTQTKKMIAQGIKLKNKAREAEIEVNKLKTEKLQTDIIYKSKELANITMSTIQKNIILGEIKENLMDLSTENQALKNNSKISQLIRKINKTIEQKDEWLVFEQNFDQVHENFLHHLKEKHPDLTAKDMRLAAYLRMNLSSKEIAPLMNISIRSVEISRYRLRKKIIIDHHKNLYDYLIGL